MEVRCFIIIPLVLLGSTSEMDMLDFGPDAGDTFTVKWNDVCSTEQRLSRTLSFYGMEYQSLFVCENGLVSFGEPVAAFTPESFPIAGKAVIAPLWMDLDIRDPLVDYGDFTEYSEAVYTFNAEAILDDDNNIYLTGEARGEIEQYGITSFTCSTGERIVFIFVCDGIRNCRSGEDEADCPDPYYSRVHHQRLNGDDRVSSVLFNQHEVDQDLRVNLANNIFKREVSDPQTLRYLSSVLEERLNGEASVDWAYVVTWYNIGIYQGHIDAFNTFQLVLATANFESEHKTFVFFLYDRIQRTHSDSHSGTHAQAGFNDGAGNYYMLPGSRMPEVRNLVLSSNVGDPGTWIFMLDDVSGVECSSHDVIIRPVLADQYGGTEFTVSGYCGIPMNATLQLELTGRGRMRLVEATVTQENTIIGKYPYWGKSESVRARVVIDSIGQSKFLDITYTDCQYRFGESCINVHLEQDPGMNIINITWNSSDIDSEEVNVILWGGNTIPSADDGLPGLEVTPISVLTQSNSGHSNLSLLSGRRARSSSSPEFLQVSVAVQRPEENSEHFENDDETIISQPFLRRARGRGNNEAFKCRSWLERERERGKSWHDELSKRFGCPAVDSRFGVHFPDSWFADREIRFGFRGWVNDSNCGPVSNEFCDLFCIRSMQHLVQDDLGEIFEASNRCCYHSSGDLITEIWKGAGRAHRTALYFSKDSYEDDVKSFQYCCGTAGDLCDQYYEFRPVITGYIPSLGRRFNPTLARIQRGDPHIETFDGLLYTFNGLGVYTLLASETKDVEVQVSTRVFGRGTVFSGIAVRDASNVLTMFQSQDGSLQLVIDRNRVELGVLSQYSVHGVSIRESEDRSTFTFGLPSELSVRVLVREGVMNLGVSLTASWHNQTFGLMGDFDGDTTNDLAASNGTLWSAEMVESPDTLNMTRAEALAILHEGFGESWHVNTSNWLFAAETRFKLQQEFDLNSDFRADYTLSFATEEEQRRAEEACSAAGQYDLCLLDVSLTNDTRFASVAQGLEEEIEVTAILFRGTNDVPLSASDVNPNASEVPPSNSPSSSKANGEAGDNTIIVIIVVGIGVLITAILAASVALTSSRSFCHANIVHRI